ncbi:hypothetical protein PZH43_13295, partial [Streptococcus gordonii]|nr:hypothetical protein [Streptococcus gordonii]
PVLAIFCCSLNGKTRYRSNGRNGQHGTLLVAQGGEIEEHEPTSSPVGTKIKIEDLFLNSPARLKYMKSQQAELSHIVDVFNRLCLAHPEVAFTLISDGREMT